MAELRESKPPVVMFDDGRQEKSDRPELKSPADYYATYFKPAADAAEKVQEAVKPAKP